MYGDAFGGNRMRLNAFLGRLQVQSIAPDTSFGFLIANPNAPINRVYPPGHGNGLVVLGDAKQAARLGLSPTSGGNLLASFPNATPQFTSVGNYGPLRSQYQSFVFSQNGGILSFPITDNPAYRNAANGLFNQLYGPNGTTAFVSGSSQAIYNVTGGSEVPSGPVFIGPPDTAEITNTYDRFLVLDLPTPAAGGVVGRTKISEDNNPLPRDRFIFNYDLFGGTQLAPGGYDVHRFAPGIEKTFLDQQASVEVRFPFASTLSPTGIADGGISNREAVFGNIFTTLKFLAYSEDTFHVAAGFGMSLPTAPDTVVKSFDGSDLLRIKNESLLFVPYLASIYTPNDRLFWQNWVSLSFDATGSPVVANPNLLGAGQGPQTIGRIRDQSVLAIDSQFGYWLIPPNSRSGILQGLAPFLELHYNSSVSDVSNVRSGNFQFVNSDNRYDELNLTSGVAVYFDSNLLVSAAVSLPMKSGPDKFFDYQVGVRASWFFGPTAANRNALRFGR
jgi:hypothetical protein